MYTIGVLVAENLTSQEAILDACDALMVRYGFRKMSMDDVAKKAGVSRRTIYNLFRSKEDLGLSSIGRVVSQVFAEMEEIAGSGAPSAERLQACLHQRVLGRLRRVRDYASSLDELFEAVRPAYLARRREMFERESALLRRILAEGIESGEFRPGTTGFADSMILATNAFIPYSLSPAELGDEIEVVARLDRMTELLISSVAKTASED